MEDLVWYTHGVNMRLDTRTSLGTFANFSSVATIVKSLLFSNLAELCKELCSFRLCALYFIHL